MFHIFVQDFQLSLAVSATNPIQLGNSNGHYTL